MGMKKSRRRKKRISKIRSKAKAAKTKKTTSKTKKTRPSRRRNVGKPAPAPKAKVVKTTETRPSRRRNVGKPAPAPAPKAKAVKTTGPGMSMRDKARARHANFKATGVQTHGGTRKNYTKKEAMKIEKALGRGSFRTVTRGARNPLGDRRAVQNAVSMQINTPFGPVADGAKYAENITNYGMRFGKTPEARAKAYEQSLDPNSFKGLSDGMTFGSGPVASGDAYARGLNADLNNTENRLRAGRNLFSRLTLGTVPPVRRLTDKEIADRRVSINRGPKGGARFNPTLAKQQDRPKTMQVGGDRPLVAQAQTTATTAPADEEAVKEEEVQEVQADTAQQNYPDLSDISQDEYNTVIEGINQIETTGGNNVSSQPDVASIAQTTGVDPGIIERILAGYRGKKRIKFGTGKNESLKLRRGNVGFTSRIPDFVLSSLNV